MTYAEVYDLITKYLYDRTDLTAIVPQLVTLAERKLYQRLRVQENQAWKYYRAGDDNSDGQAEDGILLDADFISLMMVGARDPGAPGEYRVLKQLQEDEWSRQAYYATGPVANYMLFQNTLRFHPRPMDDDTYIYVRYYRDLAMHKSDHDAYPTNEVLTTYPNLILHGALIEAAAYLGEDSRIPIWRQEYEAALQNANAREVEQSMSTGSVQVKAAY